MTQNATQPSLNGFKILLVISGGIAAYKTPELVRLLKKSGADVTCILTRGGAQFVTPMTLTTLSQNRVYTDLWSVEDEQQIGHIALGRACDLVLVAPATADIIAKMAHGLCDDLATTCLLATPRPVLVAPAMNPVMYDHAATQANIATLSARGVGILSPDAGDMACGEVGTGRMREPATLLADIAHHLHSGPLAGRRAVVTSGPTYESLDPVRFIGNHSSGKQGHAIAAALSRAGADVTLVSGPVSIPDPAGVKTVHVRSASEMRDAALSALPADIAVCAAAVCDWTPKNVAADKMKKTGSAPQIELVESPDILKTIGHLPDGTRPRIVVGFAAETTDVAAAAQRKVETKRADIILGNDVSGGAIFGADTGHVIAYPAGDDWGQMTKDDIARALTNTIIERLSA